MASRRVIFLSMVLWMESINITSFRRAGDRQNPSPGRGAYYTAVCPLSAPFIRVRCDARCPRVFFVAAAKDAPCHTLIQTPCPSRALDGWVTRPAGGKSGADMGEFSFTFSLRAPRWFRCPSMFDSEGRCSRRISLLFHKNRRSPAQNCAPQGPGPAQTLL